MSEIDSELPKKLQAYFNDKLLNKLTPCHLGKKIKFRKYGTGPLDKGNGFNKWVCTCHDSMEEHFQDIAKKSGEPVARTLYNAMVCSILKTEKEIMMETYDEMMKDSLKEEGEDD